MTDAETVVSGVQYGRICRTSRYVRHFTAIIMSYIAVELYCMCVKRNWVIKDARCCTTWGFTFLYRIDPNVCDCLCGDDCQRHISCVRNRYFQNDRYSIWICNRIDEYVDRDHDHLFLDPRIMDREDSWGEHYYLILDTNCFSLNMAANAQGANYPLAGEFNNSYVTVGGSGATLGLIIFIAFMAKSDQLKVLGKASLVPGDLQYQ